MQKKILTIKNLNVTFSTPKGPFHAVKDINFSMGVEKVGVVGESGSGKSITSKSVLGLLRKPTRVEADEISFHDIDLRNLDNKQWRKIRGRKISMIMQDPHYSLNPIMSVGKQIMESYRTHHKVSKAEAKAKTLKMLESVRINNPEHVFNAYPHEISGGMGQRIMIAMMLIPEPELLIADEPTSALDVSVQNQILSLINEMVTQRNMGLIFISHDLNLVSRFCDRVLIMYRGRIVDECLASELHASKHPYTQGLLNCVPSLDHKKPRLEVLNREKLRSFE